MPFDKQKMSEPATVLDVTQVYFDLNNATLLLSLAIKGLAEKAHVDISEEIAAVDTALVAMRENFNVTTGWKD